MQHQIRAIMGVGLLLRPRGSDGLDRGIAICLLVQVIVILSFMGLAQRYIAEVYPSHLPHAIVGPVVLSAVINSLATASMLGEERILPVETRAFWEMGQE